MSRQLASIAVIFGLLAIASGNDPSWGSGDPMLGDFKGNRFEFFGKSGHFYNVYSDGAHQFNMGLFPGVLNGHNGTYMGEYGISCGTSRINVTLVGTGDLRVEMWQNEDQEPSVLHSGKPLQAILGDQNSKLAVNMEAYEFPGAHSVEIKSDVMSWVIRSAPAGEVDGFGVVQPAYLNFEMSLLKSPVGNKAAGIIGESANQGAEAGDLKSSSADSEAIKGLTAEQDKTRPKDAFYEVTGMFGTDFAANLFTGAAVTSPVGTFRRSMLQTDLFAGVHFPLHASSN